MDALHKLNKVNDICFFVRDFKGSVDFFTEKFALKLKRLQPDDENPNYAEFDFLGTTVTLWDEKGVSEVIDAKYLGGEGHHFMIAIKVPNVQDVDDIYTALVSRGVVCIKPPVTYPFGSRAAYFLDHEKNVWEVFAWLAGNGPGLL
jgi:catechol 2,3-dioxygenase-like lactoylglutathione lyase family enzyme